MVDGAALADTARAVGTAVLRTYTLGAGLAEAGDAEVDVEGAEAAAGTARRDAVVCSDRLRGRAERSAEDTRRDVGAMSSEFETEPEQTEVSQTGCRRWKR
jgi:hypothetical protein